MKLKRVDIFQAKTIRGATKIPTELRYRIEVRLLRRRRQIADRHVLHHAAAKRADLAIGKPAVLRAGSNEGVERLGFFQDRADRALRHFEHDRVGGCGQHLDSIPPYCLSSCLAAASWSRR